MSLRSKALQWYKSKYGSDDIPIYTSKFYQPYESWPKTNVWWPQIPIKAIDLNQSGYINILCQVKPNKYEFHFLKVPTKFLIDHLNEFHTLNGKISLYLSADPKRLFIEERGKGNLNFGNFLTTEKVSKTQ